MTDPVILHQMFNRIKSVTNNPYLLLYYSKCASVYQNTEFVIYKRFDCEIDLLFDISLR